MTENQSTCNTCNKLVPATATERDGKIYLVKECPGCGTSETLISGDAARYQRKRDLDEGFNYEHCDLKCLGCKHKTPNIVFVDITNRCNLNCPICINNTPSMGFLFEPPLEYFEHIFDHYAAQDPKPSIQLFGGEPTVRKDLFEIIAMSRDRGLPTRVVTNGVKLADEDYCRRLIESRATILIAYDGDSPELYRRLRNSEKCLEQKKQALANIQKIGGAKVTLMTLAAKNFNDDQIPGLFDYAHTMRGTVRAVYFMPLAHTWKHADFDLEPDRITGEDIEQIVDDTFPEDPVEFLPAMFLGQIPTLVKYLKIKPLPFAGAHPNCESMYMLISDGERYQPLGHYLKSSTSDFARALREAEADLSRRAAAVETHRGAQYPERPTRAEKRLRLRALRAVFGVLRRHGRVGRFLKGSGLGKLYHGLALAFGMVFARSSRKVFAKHGAIHGSLQLIVLPFEDKFTLETQRLERCPSAFSFWDVDRKTVKHVPVCAWGLHKTQVMRRIMEHYAPNPADQPLESVGATV